MPHTKSAEKALRQTEKRRLRNRANRKTLKTQLKAFLAVLKTATPDELRAAYNETAKQIDKAAAKGVIHSNAAARKKSQYSLMLNAALAAKK